MEQLKLLVIGERRTDGGALKERVLRAATGLANLGVGSGDRVAILMRNDQPQIEATLATQYLGAYPVQMNWHGQSDEHAFVLKDCSADVLVAHIDLLVEMPPSDRPSKVIAAMPPADLIAAYKIAPQRLTWPDDVMNWETWVSAQPPRQEAPKAALESIIYTSGTTGRPKGVQRYAPTPEQVSMTERMRKQVFGIGAGARVLVPAPLYHTAPNMFAMRAIRQAEALVLPTRFDPIGLLEDIERYRITHLYAVPTIFIRLLALPKDERAKHDLSSLEFALHAGAPCAPSVKQAMLDWWGPIIHEYYGSTEAGPSTFCRAKDWLARPGTIGRAAEGVTIEVHDDLGQSLPIGEIGELCVRNAGYADFTYLNRPEARAELQRGNFMMSGDLGYRDAEGFYFLCDRKRDLVISGGVNIYPAEIEAVLQSMDGVADSVVFGIPDPEFGEGLAALVELEPGQELQVEEIREFLLHKLARFKVPSLVEIRISLPRDESGKIKKRLLRDPYWTGVDRKI